MKRSKHVLKFALLSGVLSFAMVWISGDRPDWLPVPDDLLRFSPGLIFGLLVLVGQTAALPGRWLRAIAVVACTTLIYFLMVRLANTIVDSDRSALVACGIAGGLGALLTALSIRLLLARELSLLALVMAFVLGTLGGSLIGQAIVTSEVDSIVQLLVLSGFLLWQGGVSFALLMIDPLGDEPDNWPPSSSPE